MWNVQDCNCDFFSSGRISCSCPFNSTLRQNIWKRPVIALNTWGADYKLPPHSLMCHSKKPASRRNWCRVMALGIWMDKEFQSVIHRTVSFLSRRRTYYSFKVWMKKLNSMHRPKINQNLRIKTKLVVEGADVMVYVWFSCTYSI